ncbi:uncharacterized protein (DUF305 family) [Pseudonocardia sediminis]|uniref:Uncharacterized protein (DUF305 family) n=1 Tax=Pseudonocardia sediminis TaxID=1397368 RepID=A0A4Q7UX34_PSEST|nr:DUF305 domain-containing protein [Pseudonocardia sediminis]RZT85588.1 uncharacterized protein (DUF305 family) [Pseudonocardia sediminis]
MKIKNVALAATSLTAALVLSACGSGDSPDTAAGQQQPAASSAASHGAQQDSAQHNAADIAFAQGMIPHHKQAVEMSRLADDRAGDGVKDLATRVEQAQGPEIEQMQSFLTAWGAPESGAVGGMQGMMSGQEMAQLGRASGAEFDRMFVQMMTAHREGAVQMARAELATGINPQAKALAQQIIDAQQAEITEMRDLLG